MFRLPAILEEVPPATDGFDFCFLFLSSLKSLAAGIRLGKYLVQPAPPLLHLGRRLLGRLAVLRRFLLLVCLSRWLLVHTYSPLTVVTMYRLSVD